jgi:DNA-binding transcriptional LysR family regulator
MKLNMRISLDALQVLDAIARRGSFAAAAAELHRVPSAITYTVQKLEQDLAIPLFDRSRHRARLTAAGYELLTEGRLLLRAAGDLEERIKQVARGWETELRIAVDTVIGAEKMFPLIKRFGAEKSGTRIRLTEEVLGGGWDALVSQRVDLVVGASGDVPSGSSYATLDLGRLAFVFVVAPDHPICLEPMPLTEVTLLKYRAVSVADSSRNLPPRTVGLISGQDVLTVHSIHAKLAAHVAGLGVGYLPTHIAKAAVSAKKLKVLSVASPRKHEGELVAAWRPNRTGKALRWFAKALEDKETVAGFFV